MRERRTRSNSSTEAAFCHRQEKLGPERSPVCFLVTVWHLLLLSIRNCAEMRSANQFKEAFTSKLIGLDSHRREYSLNRIFLGLPQHSLMSSGREDIGIKQPPQQHCAQVIMPSTAERDKAYHYSLGVATKGLRVERLSVCSQSPKEKRKVGRPIIYSGDPDAPNLTPQERRRIRRRIANRESARRVRAKRQDLIEEMSIKVCTPVHPNSL